MSASQTARAIRAKNDSSAFSQAVFGGHKNEDQNQQQFQEDIEERLQTDFQGKDPKKSQAIHIADSDPIYEQMQSLESRIENKLQEIDKLFVKAPTKVADD